MSPRTRDILVVGALLAATALYAAAGVKWAPHPFEDAAILMRYSKHVAEGHGIVWNVGEAPVDGATDFLFMMLLAGLARCGLSLETAVRAVGLVAHFATVALVYAGVRRLYGAPRWMAVVSAGYLAVGPGLRYASAYFGTPLFVLLACTTWWLAIRLSREGASLGVAAGFALSGLVMGLIRPEGVLLAVLMLLAVVSARGLRGSGKAIACFVVVFGVLGGAYFAWHWSYFGHPLPNPFYKKGGGALHVGGLVSAVRGAARFLLPFSLAFAAALRKRATARRIVFPLIPVAGFVAIWVLLSDEMNYLWRFQYAIQPIVLLAWPPLVMGVAREWRLPPLADLARNQRVVLRLLAAMVFVGLLGYHHRMSRLPIQFTDGNYAVGTALRGYAEKGYTMAITEAGLIPLYSGWRAIDTWGLNDAWIAHHGGVTPDYLDRHKPHLIIFHAYFSPQTPVPRETPWDDMVLGLRDYARERGYVLAAVFGTSPYDTQHYYVRPGFADSAALVATIRAVRYTSMSSGKPCFNYAMLRPIDAP